MQRNPGLSHRFGKIAFVFPELDFVNKCAYFDYQREKVYVRTSKVLKGIQKVKQREGRRTTEVLSIFVDGEFQAAWDFLTPSSKVTPAITSLKSSDPFNERQLFDALSISL